MRSTLNAFRRFVFHIASLFSLLLFVLMVLVWSSTYRDARFVQSHRRWLDDDRLACSRLVWTLSERGTIAVFIAREVSDEARVIRRFRAERDNQDSSFWRA